MSARTSAQPDAAMSALREVVDMAAIGASWANDRIAPLMNAIMVLANPENQTPTTTHNRILLIRKLAVLGSVAAEEMAADFEANGRAAESKLADLNGGCRMNAATIHTGAAPALLVELQHAHAIINAMLNAMTIQQKSKVHEQLDKAGISGEGMTRANERLAAIEAAEVGSATPSSASSQGQSQQLLDIEAQAVEVILEADRADILLEEVFEKLEGLGTSPAVLAIECFTTCAARAVSLMHEAADNIVSLVAEGVAA